MQTTAAPTPATIDGDADLLAPLRAGDAAAFETLVRRHGGRLLAVARRIVGNDEDANDVLQDTFLSAFKALEDFDGRSQLASWLHRIAVNCALQRLRSRRRKPPVCSIDELLPTFKENGHRDDPRGPWTENVDCAIARQETRTLVRRAIGKLPEDYRTVLVLRDIEGLDTAETAGALGVSEGVVKTRLHRARQALRTLLDPHMRGETR